MGLVLQRRDAARDTPAVSLCGLEGAEGLLQESALLQREGRRGRLGHWERPSDAGSPARVTTAVGDGFVPTTLQRGEAGFPHKADGVSYSVRDIFHSSHILA